MNAFGSSNKLAPKFELYKVLMKVALFVSCILAAATFLIEDQVVPPTTPTVIQADVTPVLIPLQPIEAGAVLEQSMFRIEQRPKASVGEGYINSVDQIRGFYAASLIVAGNPLHSGYVTAKRPVNQIQANIPDGFRAVTLGVDGTTSVEGWARPGAKVDVLLSSVVAGKPAIRVIVQNAKVLSAGHQNNKEQQDPATATPITVTLLVSSDEAGRIQLGYSSGSLSLILRGDEDSVESMESLIVNLDSIIGGDSSPQAAVSPVQGQVRVGGKTYHMVNGQLKPIE